MLRLKVKSVCDMILGLHRTDVDFARRELTVRWSDWNGELGLPKSGKPRKVPLAADLYELLKEHCHLRGPRVLCTEEGEPLTKKVLIRMMKKVQARAGMEETGLVHILRHTFCSHLAMRGATVTAIQKLAGHAHISTTMRYMHLSPSARDEAIALLTAPNPTRAPAEAPQAGGGHGEAEA